MKRTAIAFLVGLLVGAAAMFLGRSWLRGDWPFEHRAVHVPAARGSGWATPIAGAGLTNAHQVAPGLYRGAQPTAEGMKTLQAMGIRTVVNLRNLHSDRDELEGTSLKYHHLHVATLFPEHDEIVSFLRIAADESNQPVFVHCMHGSDRTGMMCAAYRVVIQGWPKDEAFREMRDGGFGFHGDFQHLLRQIEKLDVEAVRKEIGMSERATGTK